MFKVGDLVHWESQAAGSCTRKDGKIYEIIPNRKLPRQRGYGSYDGGYPNHKIMFDSVMPRNHESYLVEVPGGKTEKAMPRLYWPYASKLVKG